MGPVRESRRKHKVKKDKNKEVEEEYGEGFVKKEPVTPGNIKGPQGAQITTQAGREGAVGGIDTGGTGEHARLENCENNSISYNWSFRKTWKLYGHAWSRSIISTSSTPPRYFMSTSMMALPIDYPFMYMTPAEWYLLEAESYVTGVKQTCTLLNCRTSFQANSSDVQTATQGNQLFVNYAHGIEHKYPVSVVFNFGASTQPAKVTSITQIDDTDSEAVIKKFYGDDMSKLTYPPGLCGTWQEWDWYAAFNLGEWSSVNSVGIWNVDAAYDSFNAVPNYNTVIGSNEYDFGQTLLTNQFNPYIPGYAPFTSGNLSFLKDKCHVLHDGTVQYSLDTQNYRQINKDPIVNKLVGPGADYHKSMWHPGYNKLGYNTANSKTPSWMYIGLQDIPAITSTTDAVTYQEGQIFIELECEISGITKKSSVTSQQIRKHYTDMIYSYNAEDITLNDRGQGFIFGRPYTERPTVK
ncbi:hypothetical protein B7P43_G09121 [Cryptotermes secundus]|uniref:Capsid protein n=1 Tax=Cryptotermes secundus TaxID=105785 RepID=A0A2J7Q3C8_9NEOP|nr:hypothetical protein B7P43_G09121 [Cryptotermes secundus]